MKYSKKKAEKKSKAKALSNVTYTIKTPTLKNKGFFGAGSHDLENPLMQSAILFGFLVNPKTNEQAIISDFNSIYNGNGNNKLICYYIISKNFITDVPIVLVYFPPTEPVKKIFIECIMVEESLPTSRLVCRPITNLEYLEKMKTNDSVKK